MTSAILISFGLIMVWFAIRTKEQITAITLSFISSAIWLACIIYTRANPIGDMATGDGADNAVLTVFLALMVLVPVITWRVKNNERKRTEKEDNYKESALPRKRQTMRDASSTRIVKETDEEYYDRLYGMTHPRK